jgi:thiol-disulfide isomerase/thioredoxin
MKNRVLFSVLLSMLLIWQACDIIEEPYIDKRTGNGGNGNDTVLLVKKRALIEEFTGHDCPFCPGGAVAIEEILSVYGDQVVVVTIHAPWQGRPMPPTFPDDYRTTTGSALDNFFGMEFSGLPKGMVSRTQYPTTNQLGPSLLQGRVMEVLEEDPLLDVKIDVVFQPANRLADIEVNVSTLEELQRQLMLSVFITEDSLVSPQKNNNANIGPTPVIHDYVHRHVMRASVDNSTWGTVLSDGNVMIAEGAKYKRNFQYTLAGSWKEHHCAVVAFVYDGETYEVLQAVEVKIK